MPLRPVGPDSHSPPDSVPLGRGCLQAGNLTLMRAATIRHRFLPIALATLGAAIVLSGCTKPAPGVSVFSGTVTEYRQATCWAFDAPTLGAGECAQDLIAQAVEGDAVSIIPVLPGGVVGISVDPAVADTGWTIVLGNQRLTQTTLNTTYHRFTLPEQAVIPEAGVQLLVLAGNGNDTRGIWVFKLDPA